MLDVAPGHVGGQDEGGDLAGGTISGGDGVSGVARDVSGESVRRCQPSRADAMAPMSLCRGRVEL